MLQDCNIFTSLNASWCKTGSNKCYMFKILPNREWIKILSNILMLRGNFQINRHKLQTPMHKSQTKCLKKSNIVNNLKGHNKCQRVRTKILKGKKKCQKMRGKRMKKKKNTKKVKKKGVKMGGFHFIGVTICKRLDVQFLLYTFF